ncbi:hypothetical protein TPHA_0I01390 [Tetrapisispora phaffii CBS 4417]|uniref:Mitochondrial import receptor subunit TOM22 n=1 Tax=Tetrapisispora phaffii (strain ATCC 24235 / CBS 4417 / NBRC 1672 / NRRL Y-8282 / UCD 70-5) TaxID=1071381 RepID=G8BXL7_TETPH|nr:hypothetical protein TPHA_0I01390 [Tetrapisispora phaffii CBS 4417]CCE64645.1 hypothetical protein TPHA_0I01390 [Tetrapisispora phaffii CBS 4417]
MLLSNNVNSLTYENLMSKVVLSEQKDIIDYIEDIEYESELDYLSYEKELFYDDIGDEYYDYLGNQEIYDLFDVEHELVEGSHCLNRKRKSSCAFQHIVSDNESQSISSYKFLNIFPLKYRETVEILLNNLSTSTRCFFNMSKRIVWNISMSSLLLGMPLYLTIMLERQTLENERYFELLPYTNLSGI